MDLPDPRRLSGWRKQIANSGRHLRSKEQTRGGLAQLFTRENVSLQQLSQDIDGTYHEHLHSP